MTMSEKDFEFVCARIDEEKDLLNSISQDIWKMPEVMFKEFHAHGILTSALKKYGFQVQKHYFLTTAFRGEYVSKVAGGPTIAILLEYDALPDIGHACGHNLIAEAGLAAALGVKAAMEADSSLTGKLIVLGTPAEESGGGKIRLIELGAFDGVDVALMVHPAPSYRANVFHQFSALLECSIQFKGKEAHSVSCPWEGRNALDAAVACYTAISLLRQQMKNTCKVHGVITKGGVVPNIIPGETRLEYYIRALTMGDLRELQTKVTACIEGAASITGCQVDIRYDESNLYENVLTNKTLGTVFQSFAERLGLKFVPQGLDSPSTGSTDMGNVSHVVPAIHPLYGINTDCGTHTKDFANVARSDEAQEPTLAAAKAMALTALKVMRYPEMLDEIKKQFQQDICKDKNS